MQEEISISTAYITLGQFLKLIGVVATGGQVKWYVEEFQIKVNGHTEKRRGKKLVPGDNVEIEEVGKFQIVSNG